MTLFQRVVVPVATEEDAQSTGAALAPYLEPGSRVHVVHVVEDVEGAPDPTPSSAMMEEAEAFFDAFEEALGPDAAVEREIRHEPDVAAAILEVAHEVEATAVAFTPRGGSRWVKLLAGDVTTPLIQNARVPVVVLPDGEV